MNVRSAQNALMTAQARFEQWRARWLQSWAEPDQQARLKRYYQMLSAEAKDQLREQDPEGFAKLERFIHQK